MKVTVITTDAGEIVGVQHGHSCVVDRLVQGARVVAGPAQRLHEIEVPDHLEDLSKGQELLTHVKQQIK
jgi:hypothetical protein